MQRVLTAVLVVFTLAVISMPAQDAPAPAPPPPPPPAVKVDGTWNMTIDMSLGISTPTLALTQDGNRIGGTYTSRYGEFPLSGILKGRSIELAITMTAGDTPVDMTFTGEVAADAQFMKGQATLGDMGEATWSAVRDKTPAK